MKHFARALSLGIVAGMFAFPGLPALAGEEEMIIETPKVFKKDRVNGVDGYWVEYQKKKYKKIQHSASGSLGAGGKYAGAQDNIFSKAFGGNYKLSDAAHQQLNNSSYFNIGDPDHNLNQNAFERDVKELAKLTSGSTEDLVGEWGGNLAAMGLDYVNWSAGGWDARYVYTNSDGGHTLGYHHGVDIDKGLTAENQGAFNGIAGQSYQAAFGNPGVIKQVAKSSQIQPLLESIRLRKMAELIDRGLPLPEGYKIDLTVNVPQGELVLAENTASLNSGGGAAANLRKMADQLITLIQRTHSPIALDLNHDGKIGVTGWSSARKRDGKNKFVDKGSVWFDISGEGKKRKIEWLNADGDGFLVWDKENRVTNAIGQGGVVTASILFGNAVGYEHGYGKLMAYTKTVDVAAILNGNDHQWAAVFRASQPLKTDQLKDLKIWTDGNRDGKVQVGELKSLKDLGISEIGVAPKLVRNKDKEILIQSYYVQNGKRYMTEDVWFAEDPAAQPN